MLKVAARDCHQNHFGAEEEELKEDSDNMYVQKQ